MCCNPIHYPLKPTRRKVYPNLSIYRVVLPGLAKLNRCFFQQCRCTRKVKYIDPRNRTWTIPRETMATATGRSSHTRLCIACTNSNHPRRRVVKHVLDYVTREGLALIIRPKIRRSLAVSATDRRGRSGRRRRRR